MLLRATHDEMVNKLVNNFATISSGFQTFSTQISTSLSAPKQMVSDVADDLIVPVTPSDRSKGPEVPGPTFVPPLLPQLDKENYLNIKHWSPDEYNSYRKGGKRGGENTPTNRPTSSILLSYMEDENGNQVSDKTKKATRATAKGFFEQLLQDNNAPAAWGSAPLSTRNKLINILESEFPFLRFCEGHWKANQVATNSYSQWYQHAVDRKAGVEAKKAKKKAAAGAAEDEVIDVDIDKNNTGEPSKRPREEGDNVPGPSKRPRVEDPRPTPAPRPLPTGTNLQREKVCKSFILTILITKNKLSGSIVWVYDYMCREVVD